MTKNYYTVQQFAESKKVSHQAIYRAISAGILDFEMIGNTKFIPKGTLYSPRKKNKSTKNQQLK